MRALKPQKVGRAGPINGMSVDIFLDRNKLDFFAKIEEHEVRAATADEAQALANRMLRDFRPTTWRQMMWLRAETPENWCIHTEFGSSCGIWFGRFEEAIVQKVTIRRPHPLDAPMKDIGARRKDKRFGWDSVESWQNYQRHKYLSGDKGEPYDQARWDRLIQLQDAIAALGKELKKIQAKPELIMSTGAPLLGIGGVR